ncbi:MAG: hypothetical protein Q7S52_03510 [bacterium]|nr:hypothetical protein [bacterium]
MNTPVVNSDIIETRNGITVLLHFSRAVGEPRSYFIEIIYERGLIVAP